MQISIATTNGKTINLEVEDSESVLQIKQKINLLEGIPSDHQKLILNGLLLEDLKTLADYQASKELPFTLKVKEISVQIKCIGEAPFFIEVEPTETVAHLKTRIFEVKGIKVDDMSLTFKGKKLDNDSAIISSYGLRDKAILLLVKRSKPNLSTSSSSSPPSVASNCLNNCGFFGNPATMNYCSKCFKDLGLSNNNNNNVSIKKEEIISEETKKEVVTEEKENKESESPKQTDKSKCWKCNKKIGIYGFECRCKYFFCEKHRYNDLHDCKFNYSEFQKANLVVKLEKVVEKKVKDI